MFWVKVSILFLFGLRVSAEQQQQRQRSHSGFRKLYVLQPGPAGADGGLTISSISSRRGAAGQPSTYNVELSAGFGGQVRTRRMGNQVAVAPHYGQQQGAFSQQTHPVKLSG